MSFASVIVPVKNRPEATRRLVESFLEQTYAKSELIIVGDFSDTTWPAIEEFVSERVRIIKAEVLSDGRDANAKRNIGLAAAKGDVLVLTDSDIVLPPDWLEKGMRLLETEGHEVVAGGMMTVGEGNFLATYVDTNPVGAKTCRFDPPYVLTADNAGKGRYKQPITANLFLTRRVYETVGGLDADFTTPYEDYPYVDRIIWGGNSVLCTSELDVWHSHRDSAPELAKEYWNAGAGCADYVLRYGESHLARARVRQLAVLAVSVPLWFALLVILPVVTISTTAAVAAVASIVIAWKVGRPSALWYFGITACLSLLFSAGMIRGFVDRSLNEQLATKVVSTHELAVQTQDA